MFINKLGIWIVDSEITPLVTAALGAFTIIGLLKLPALLVIASLVLAVILGEWAFEDWLKSRWTKVSSGDAICSKIWFVICSLPATVIPIGTGFFVVKNAKGWFNYFQQVDWLLVVLATLTTLVAALVIGSWLVYTSELSERHNEQVEAREEEQRLKERKRLNKRTKPTR